MLTTLTNLSEKWVKHQFIKLIVAFIILLIFVLAEYVKIFPVLWGSTTSWQKTDAALEIIGVLSAIATMLFGVVGAMVVLIANLYNLPWRDARQYVFGGMFLIGYPIARIERGEIIPEENGRAVKEIGGPGILKIQYDSAVLMEKLGQFSRVLGPGRHLLRPGEYIREVVELGPLERTRKARSWTRDGLPFETQLEVHFSIQPQSNNGNGNGHASTPNFFDKLLDSLLGKPAPSTPIYPFDKKAIRQAVYSRTVGWTRSGEPKTVGWHDQLANHARSSLATLMSQHTLDRLTEPEQGSARLLKTDETPRFAIVQQWQERLDKKAQELGATILQCHYEAVEIDEKYAELDKTIEKQRLTTWRTPWASRAKLTRALGQAEAFRLMEMTRAQAQVKMIGALTQDAKHNDPAAAKRLLALRMIETIELMLQKKSGDISAKVPDLLRQIQELLK